MMTTKTITPEFTGDQESAKTFSRRSDAKKYAERRGLTRIRIDEVYHGEYVVIDLERSEPCDPWYVR